MKDKKKFLIIRRYEVEGETEDQALEEFYMGYGAGGPDQIAEEVYELTGR